MMPRLEAGEMLGALHVQGLAQASGDHPAKQEAVAKLEARAMGHVIKPEKPQKPNVDQLAGMGIGVVIEPAAHG
jgi:hypothetical protein